MKNETIRRVTGKALELAPLFLTAWLGAAAQSMMGDVKAGSTIAFYTSGYSSTGATAMQYSIVFTVIYAGP